MGVWDGVARKAPLSKQDLIVRIEELTEGPRVLAQPGVKPLELGVRSGAHEVRAVLNEDGVVLGEGEAQVGAVHFLLCDDLKRKRGYGALTEG